MGHYVKWNMSHEGFTTSKCGRFAIVPLFCGSTRPQTFTLKRIQEDGTGREISKYNETQREAKEDAETQVEKEFQHDHAALRQ